MGDVVDRLGAVLLDGAIAATALLGAVALAMVACGQPARRLLLARFAVLGSLLILPLMVFAPIPRFSVLVPIAAFLESGPGPVLVEPDDPADGWPLPRRTAVAMALGGMAIGGGGLLLGAIGARRLLHRTVEPAPETEAILDELTSGRRRWKPGVRVSARVRRPMLIGLLRPTILIPPDLEEPDQVEPLRLALLHELAHAERHDPAFGLAGGVAASLWFFVPPMWWLRAQMRLDQEFLADRGASGRFGSDADYAKSLVGLAQGDPEADREARPASVASGAGMSALVLRVLMLVRCPFPVEVRAPRWWGVVCASALACGTVAASGLTIRAVPGGWRCAPPCHEVRTEHGSLQVNRLMLDARPAGPDGRVPPYTLLTTLPRRFEMVVEVLADPDDLPEIAIAGRRLAAPRKSPSDGSSFTGYHKVRLVRDDAGLRLWVGGKPVGPSPGDGPIPRFLALQPAPKLAGRYRNLFLTW
jgi:BlaR1 peptidase M56